MHMHQDRTIGIYLNCSQVLVVFLMAIIANYGICHTHIVDRVGLSIKTHALLMLIYWRIV